MGFVNTSQGDLGLGLVSMSTSYTGPIRDWTRDWHQHGLRMAQPFYVPPKEVTTTREVKLATQAMKESSPSRQLAISRSSASLNSNYPEHSRLMLRDSRTHNPRYAFCTKSTERSDSLRPKTGGQLDSMWSGINSAKGEDVW